MFTYYEQMDVILKITEVVKWRFPTHNHNKCATQPREYCSSDYWNVSYTMQ